VAVALLLVVANGFFVAVEFSLLAARRGRIEEWAEEGRFGATSALAGMRRLNVQLAACQLGITVMSLLLGLLVEPVVGGGLERLLGGTALPEGVSRAVGLAVGLLVVSFLHMVLGEMVPKSLALSSPERTVVLLAPLNRGITFLLSPVVVVLNRLGNWGTKLLRVEPADELSQSHTAMEIAAMLEDSAAGGELEHDEHLLLTGALGFLTVTVGEVMTPSDRLVTVPSSATLAEAEQLLHRSGHSRVLVTSPVDGEVVGFLHVKDLLRHSGDPDGPLPPGLVRTALKVRPGEALPDVLPRMRRARRHVAVVTQGPVLLGLVTLEDLLEAIVGDISDESDKMERSRRWRRAD
jgi:CBS domain containing-hemolysin-like protein